MPLTPIDCYLNIYLIFFAEMSKTQVPVPPRPKLRTQPSKAQMTVMQAFYGIVYRFDQETKWQAAQQDYIKIDFIDLSTPSDNQYRIEALSSGNQVRL